MLKAGFVFSSGLDKFGGFFNDFKFVHLGRQQL